MGLRYLDDSTDSKREQDGGGRLRFLDEGAGGGEDLPSRTWTEALVTDPGAAMLGGLVSVSKLPAMALDRAVAGQWVGPGVEALTAFEDSVNAQKSDRLLAKEQQSQGRVAMLGQRAADAVGGGDGFIPTTARIATEFGAGAYEALKDPALLSAQLAQQVPMLGASRLGGLATARVAQTAAAAAPAAAATKLGQAALAGAGTAGAVVAGAGLQASDIGSDAYQRLMRLPDEKWAALPGYSELAQQIGSEEAKSRLASDKAWVAALQAGAASVLSTMLPGGTTVERALVTGRLPAGVSPARAVLSGARGEFVQEGVEEGYGQVAANEAVRGVDPKQSLAEGVGAAAGQGAALGGLLGGGANVGSLLAARRGRITERAALPEQATAEGGQSTPAGAIAAEEVLGAAPRETPPAAAPVAPTEAEKALLQPRPLTALDRVDEIARALPAAPEAEREALQVERERLTANWPKTEPGAQTSLTTEAGVRVQAQYALAEAGDLVTSHDVYLRQNAQYPQELQPRERDRAASAQQINSIVNRFDPARVGASADAATGAPIVGADGLVESGNARTIALKRIYQANGQRAVDYKAFLRDNAAQFGLLPEQVDGMRQPVLVRVRSTPVNRAEFARQASADTVARMSPSEQARSDAARIDVLGDLNPDDNGDFASSRDFIRRFMARLPTTEQSGMIDAEGRLSSSGYARVRNAVLAKAYGDSPVLTRMVESMDDNQRNVSRALMIAAPRVARARAAIGAGQLHDADLTPHLVAAADEMARAKDAGRSVDNVLAQAGLLGDEAPPETRELMQFLAENARRPRRMAEFITAYFDALESLGHPGQGSLLGEQAPPAKSDLIGAARRVATGVQDESQVVAADTQRGVDPATGQRLEGQRADAQGSGRGDQGDRAAAGEVDALTAQRSEAVGRMRDALGDLADLLGKNVRAAWLPEDTPGLMPTLVRLFDAAFDIVGTDLQRAVTWVREQIKADPRTAQALAKIAPVTLRKAAHQSLGKRGTESGAQDGLFSVEDLPQLAQMPIDQSAQNALFEEPVSAVDSTSGEQRQPDSEQRPATPVAESHVPGRSADGDAGVAPGLGGGAPRLLEDAGQKIGGARKDLWKERGLRAADLDGMTEAEGATLATKQNAWNPDWSAMAADVGEPVTVAMVKVVYDSLAAKPRIDSPQGRRDYLKAMAAVREVYGAVRMPDEVKNAFVKLRQALGVSDRRSGLSEAESEARRVLFSVYKGRSDPFVFSYNELARAKKLVADGFPGAVEPWTRRFSLRQIGGEGVTERGLEIYGRRAEQFGTPLTPEQIRAGAWAITTKVGSEVGYAPTKADAEAAAKAIYERVIGTNGNEKHEPVRPHLDALKRSGLAQRIDRDVIAQDLIDTFGFRGIEWGNWAAQDERQKIANMAFDSLSDLAQILNVPERAMSLNGTMGLAFGARGGGKFAAHYESGKLVINMTKLRGAGSLAHEWAHAVDHYFGELDRADAYQGKARGASGWYEQQRYSGEPQQRMVQRDGKWTPEKVARLGNLRPELAAKIEALMKRLYETPIPREEATSIMQADIDRFEGYLHNEPSDLSKEGLREAISQKRQALAALQAGGDSTRTKRSSFAEEAQKLSGKSGGYWTRPTEMFARAFEAYVFDRLKAMGARSDYLVHGVEQERFADGTRYKGNPYPTGEERAAINKAFDDLVGEIKTRPGENGNVAMFSRAKDPARIAEERALKELAENDELFAYPKSRRTTIAGIAAEINPGVKVEAHENEGLSRYDLTMPDGDQATITVREASPYGPHSFHNLYSSANDLSVTRTERPGENREHVPPETGDVWVNLSRLKKQGWGSMIYAIAGDFAHNTDRIFIGDPNGLSAAALRRRPEHMLSQSLRWGTTDHVAPGYQQIWGDDTAGVPPLRWVYGDHLGNIGRLIDLSLGMLDTAMPSARTLDFDVTDGTFRNRAGGGRVVSRQSVREAGDRAVQKGKTVASLAGGRTLARAAVLRALLREEGATGQTERRRDGLLASLVRVLRGFGEEVHGIFYSRADVAPAAGNGIRIDSLRALAQRVRESLPDMPQVRVFESPAQLSDDGAEGTLKRQIEERGAAGDVEGALHDGQIYLFASGIADEARAEHVLANHEVAHAGLRALLGGALTTQMQAISNRNGQVRQAALALQRSDQALTHAQAVEEVLVDMPPEKLAKLDGWRALVGKARDFLRESGFSGLADRLSSWLDGKLTEQQRADLEVADLVRAARSHYARKGQSKVSTDAKLNRESLAKNGVDPGALTASEARYLIGFRSADELGNRVAAAQQAGKQRLDARASGQAQAGREDDGLSPLSTRGDARGKIDPMPARDTAPGTVGGTGAKIGGSGRLTSALLDAGKTFVYEVEKLAEQYGRVFVRWSPTAVRDLRSDSRSRDFVSGAEHPGLSAVAIDASMHPVDIAARITEYSFLRMQDRRSTPRVYLGEEIGTDSDGYSSVRMTKLLASAGKDVVRAIDARFDDAMHFQNQIEKHQRRISLGVLSAVDDVKEYQSRLASIMSNESTAPEYHGAMLSRAGTAATAAAQQQARTAEERAEELIQTPAATPKPIDATTRFLVRATGIERLASMAYGLGGRLLDRLTPESVKAGLVSDYGVPEAVVDQRAVLSAGLRSQLMAAGKLLDQLSTMTRAEARVAYEWMNMDGSDPRAYMSAMQGLPEESVAVLQQVQRMIDDLSKEAVRLGQLEPEAYKRHAGAYLRRSYFKYAAELNPGDRAARQRAITILGDQYKGRGMVLKADMAKMKQVAPEWWGRRTEAGKADTSLKGQRFVRLERRAPVGERTAVMPEVGRQAEPGRLIEVHYWPEGQPRPAKYADWDNAGSWEVRDTKGNDLILWRDFTKDEREKMGEIDEARYAIAKTLHGMIHDIEVGKYLEWLSRTQAKVDGDEISGTIVKASDRMMDVFKPGEWVQVPDTAIAGTSVKKYGALAGKYLPGPVWNDLRQIVGGRFKPLGETYEHVLRMWKISKTALSPAVHTNNIMSNFVMADWHDVSAGHVAKALRILMAGIDQRRMGALGFAARVGHKAGTADTKAAGEILRRYEVSGGAVGSWATAELAREQLAPIAEALRAEVAAAQSTAGEAGVYAALQHLLHARFPQAWELFRQSKAAAAVRTEGGNMIDLYQAEDDVFRLAAWLRAKENGLTDAEAGKIARRSFLDYNINAPWVAAMRATALPFVSFTYRAVPMLLEVAGKKPHKLFKLMALAGALNALGVALGGGGDDRERKLLPEEKAGGVWGIVPKLIRMPWNDAHGSPVYLDIRRWIPVGDVLDVGQGHAAFGLPPALLPGGPLALLGELATNRSMFTGRPITLETDTAAEKTAKVLDYLYKAFAPNLLGVPGTYATQGVVDAWKGRTDAFGREMSVQTAAANAVGIKLGAYPADVLRRNMLAKRNAQISEIDREIGGLRRQLQTHQITPEEFQQALQRQLAKERDIKARVAEQMQ